VGVAGRVILVDDDAAVRDAVVTFLRRSSGLEVVATAVDGEEGVSAFRTHRPDVVLMDLQMPRLDGTEAITRILGDFPDACVIVLTTFDSHDQVVRALRAGAAGYLLKDSSPTELVDGIAAAMAGEMPLSSRIRRSLVASVVAERTPVEPSGDQSLTPRQRELVQWLARGLTNQQIGRRMHLSEGSVKQYLAQIGTRLDAHNRTQILVRSVQLGIVDPHGLSRGGPASA
jgi:DNA-binding NarL/FixJ family response regulator